MGRQPGSAGSLSRQSESQPPRAPTTRPPPVVTSAPRQGPTLSLFDRIKARARGSEAPPTQSPRERAPSLFAEPSRDPPRRTRPASNPAPYQSNSRFGVFDEVQLAVPGKSTPSRTPAFPKRASSSGQPAPYGEFQTVSLQG